MRGLSVVESCRECGAIPMLEIRSTVVPKSYTEQAYIGRFFILLLLLSLVSSSSTNWS